MTSEQPRYFHSLHQLAVAFDHSTHGLAAMRRALYLGKRAQAEVTALHALPPMDASLEEALFPFAAMGADKADFEAELLTIARRQLLDATAEMRTELVPGDHEIYAHIGIGRPATTIIEQLAKTNADLLVCGAFGDQPSPGLLGSVTTALIAETTRPLLIAKNPGDKPPERILVCLDGSSAAAGLINWGVSLALQLGAGDVQLVTVVPDPRREDPCKLLAGLRDPKDLQSRARRRAEDCAQQSLEDLYVPFPQEAAARNLSLKLHTPSGDPVVKIAELADTSGVDMVVLATRHPERGATLSLGRVAEGVARTTACDVLLVPVEHCASRSESDA